MKYAYKITVCTDVYMTLYITVTLVMLSDVVDLCCIDQKLTAVAFCISMSYYNSVS